MSRKKQHHSDETNDFWRKYVLTRNHLKRDVAIIAGVILMVTFFSIGQKYLSILHDRRQPEPPSVTDQTPAQPENETEKTLEEVISDVDTGSWSTFSNEWYGFSLKYPQDWVKPAFRKTLGKSKQEYQFQFRNGAPVGTSRYIGFDVLVYSVANIREITATEEFPALKNPGSVSEGECSVISGQLVENESFPMEEILIGSDDACRLPAFFYSLTRDQYLYNIVAIYSDGSVSRDEGDVRKNFPEFFGAIKTFDLTDIVRPKPQPVVKKINAPSPYMYKKDSAGRKVCNKKNDHPSKSKQNKKKHLDMECCLDPDEYPNPNCYYPPEKYGKYLP